MGAIIGLLAGIWIMLVGINLVLYDILKVLKGIKEGE